MKVSLTSVRDAPPRGTQPRQDVGPGSAASAGLPRQTQPGLEDRVRVSGDFKGTSSKVTSEAAKHPEFEREAPAQREADITA